MFLDRAFPEIVTVLDRELLALSLELIPTFPTVTVVVFVLVMLCEPLLNALAVALPVDVEVELEPELEPAFELLLPLLLPPGEGGEGGAAWETIGRDRKVTTVAAARTFFIFMAKTFLLECREDEDI
jgi:hypothetical protein